MAIISSDSPAQRGPGDARRHRDKNREAIKKRLPDIIAEESIITGRKGKIVRIPIRSIQIPDFRPGHRKDNGKEGGAGIGQGSGKKGEILGRRPGEGKDPGRAGDEPGENVFDTEMDIEELIEMMLEDLGLPKLERKEIAEIEVVLGLRIRGIAKSGPHALLSRKHTAKKGVERFFSYMEILKEYTGRDELACFDALQRTDGVMQDAFTLLEDPDFVPIATEMEPFPILTNEDLRFLSLREHVARQSNAVMVAMMDRSGSMTTDKKYLARSMLFWLVNFLRKLYDNVDVRFIVHDTEAHMVPEEDFFRVSNSGGTKCSSAYELAESLIDNEYPTKSWNVYVFHFSDGDNYTDDTETCVATVKRLFAKGVNMIGYGETEPEDGRTYGRDGRLLYGGYIMSTMLQVFEEALPTHRPDPKEAGIEAVVGKDGVPFLGLAIRKKEDVLPAIRQFLQKDRWANDGK